MSEPFPASSTSTSATRRPTGPRSPSRSRAPGTPNVVYVVLDDVGFGALSCYGGLIDTPNIDRIAAAGLRYTQWHTTALCSPTRSCLLTGRNHTTNGMACITEAATGFPERQRARARRSAPPSPRCSSSAGSARPWSASGTSAPRTR